MVSYGENGEGVWVFALKNEMHEGVGLCMQNVMFMFIDFIYKESLDSIVIKHSEV